jgi:hypothetical protein
MIVMASEDSEVLDKKSLVIEGKEMVVVIPHRSYTRRHMLINAKT